MVAWKIVAIFFVATIFRDASATKIALFPSTGCYSHDVMMKQIGSQLDTTSNNITWIQTLLYDFGFGEMKLPERWTRLSLIGIDENGEYLQKNTGSLIWKQNVPFDFDTPFNIQGIKDFVLMLQRHQEYCTAMLEDRRFQQLRQENVTVAVLDHFLQECMGGLAHLLNTSVIQFSNWPLSDGYITSLNLPALPSSVPKTGTRLSGAQMTFLERCQNVLFHVAIALTRFVQMRTLDAMFASKGYPWIQVEMNEAQRPIYAARSEILFESVRPINNRVKFFGAANTPNPHNFISSMKSSKNSDKIHIQADFTVQKKWNLTEENNCDEIPCERGMRKRDTTRRRPWLFTTTTTTTDTQKIAQRRRHLESTYPELDWRQIDARPFILVTFGSVAQVENMHPELLRDLLATFAADKSRLVIWQSNLSRQEIARRHKIHVADNIQIATWIPIKELLAHENIEYIICHGGINTINELAMFGVPVLGVPLQGDQASNLARLVDLGSAELMTIIELNSALLPQKMAKMREKSSEMWRRSEILAKMVADHREFQRNSQVFWLNWVARNGKRIETRRFFRFEYLGDMENRFWAGCLAMVLAVLWVLK
ncbi:unnamed protein product [Caenorhabditis angaria]|uniref:glucuronosyltransferase n=1 Tax=Caenorhabditis angaria TaxID=860376 RepID=A0A9P1I8Q4_9PELO|nr:unnamed protein product [Caenorhabditis angaria]